MARPAPSEDLGFLSSSIRFKDALGLIEIYLNCAIRDTNGQNQTEEDLSAMGYDHLLPHAEKVKVAHPLMLRAIAAGQAEERQDAIRAQLNNGTALRSI
jgi:hypothetical protein